MSRHFDSVNTGELPASECNQWMTGILQFMKCKQDGRLAPAYFSPENKYFDQHLQTVKNETTV